MLQKNLTFSKQQYNIINFLYIGYILIYAPIQGAVDRNLMITAFLIHASARDATFALNVIAYIF